MGININVQLDNCIIVYKDEYTFYFVGKKNILDIESFINEEYNIFEIGWALIQISSKEIKIVSDRLRTVPIFYKIINNSIEISDDCNKLVSSSDIVDGYSVFLYRSAGFVLAEETLFKNIFQTEAGTIVNINIEGIYPEKFTKSYFNYGSSQFQSLDTLSLLSELKSVSNNIIKKLGHDFKNKKVLIPLSSGLDSRYVAFLIKKANLKDVLCFTYGTNKFHEVKMAEIIAKKIGLDWIHVPYSSQSWKLLRNDKEFYDYLYYSGWIGSVAHIQDWPAIRWLLKNNYITSNTVVMPGHTGDFISGGHIPAQLVSTNASISDLITYLYEKHFRVNKPNLSNKYNFDLLNYLNKLSNDGNKNEMPNYLPNFLENFDWKERQSKFIVNSVQVYNYFNLEWFLPLWSKDMIDFWVKVPVCLKFNKLLYKQHLKDIDENNIFWDIDDLRMQKNPRIKNYILKPLKQKIYKIIFGLKKQFFDYFVDAMGWYTLFSYREVIKKKRFQNINSFIVDLVLRGKGINEN
jgi:asparagine synthase (glutamine-hydrolysing)